MNLQHQPVAIPFPIPSLVSKPKLFLIEYDHSKVKAKSRNPWTVQEKHRKVTQWGTQYPNGMVTLDSGTCFHSRFEMEQYFEERGTYHIEDEMP